MKRTGLILLAAIAIVALAAPWLAPNSPDQRFDSHLYAPPTFVRVIHDGVRAPYIYQSRLVSRLERRYPLTEMTVGILGMAFKGGSDDIRSSLSYKLRRVLSFKAREVLTTDPYVTVDPDLLPLETVLERSDILVIATPHREYRELVTDKPVADIWNLLGNGVQV